MTAGKGGGQPGRRPYSIVEALNRDWDELVHRHRGSVPPWSRRQGALIGYDSLDNVLAAAQGSARRHTRRPPHRGLQRGSAR
jgi:hypothetical protein